MPNRLAKETSPYLLQHQNNPVDWYPWGEEAFAAAKKLDRPIFLSVGYSACHWCHVMEHESFESQEIAKKLNDNFISIKVDREERPDIDQIYMNAVQTLTGRGGWPMSVFLTHDKQPFFGGTYWPPKSARGMPGFDSVLDAVLDAWKNRRDALHDQAKQLTDHLKVVGAADARGDGEAKFSATTVAAAETALAKSFDAREGGFGGAPKFPHPMDLRVLLRVFHRTKRRQALDMVTLTLDKMAAGGIYDQLAGGFHRYSVDAVWLVPHFEKMLYDNALLTSAYVEAYQATGKADYARTIRETLDFILRDMTDAAGGFYSTLDADSEGEEGKYYVWTPAEIEQVLGKDDAKLFAATYDITARGNFEPHEHAGRNIPNRPRKLAEVAGEFGIDLQDFQTQLAEMRAKLLEVRAKRVPPGLDDKVLVSWNGLMIDAMATAAGVVGEPRYLTAAQNAATFILEKLRKPDGRLLHAYRHGQAKFDAYLDDYGCLINALVSLYEADFDGRWIDEAAALADVALRRFFDDKAGGFFYTADDHEELIARNKDVYDNATPSGTGIMLTALVRLGKLTGDEKYLTGAELGFRSIGELFDRAPNAVGQSLLALDLWLGPTQEVVVAAPSTAARDEVLRDLRSRFWPHKLTAAVPGKNESPHLKGVLAGKQPVKDRPALYVCENFTCRAPVVGPEAIAEELDKLAPK